MIITKPDSKEYPVYYQTYIEKVEEYDLIESLNINKTSLVKFVHNIPKNKTDYRYASGKWSIKEVLAHVVDAERIFAYRALRFARNDKAELAGFEDEKYTPESNAANRSMESILDEFQKVRDATMSLFNSFTVEMFMRSGMANGKEITVRALGFIIAGHANHHINVIKEKYLP